jgi:hypothetical protein
VLLRLVGQEYVADEEYGETLGRSPERMTGQAGRRDKGRR